MSTMWACYRCGEIGEGAMPDVHSYKDCDVSMYGEDFARARVDAWNAAVEAVLTKVAGRFGCSWDVAEIIRALKREAKL